jgi:hypothetical protein
MKKDELKKLIVEEIKEKRKQDFLKYTKENFEKMNTELDKLDGMMRKDGYEIK